MKYVKNADSQGFAHWIVPIFVIAVIAVVGAWVLKNSYAATNQGKRPFTATFSFQNLGRAETSATGVFNQIKNGLGDRQNVVYNFAEIDEGDEDRGPIDEHGALKAVFGDQGWSQFTQREPTLNRLDASVWKMTNSNSIFLHGSAPASAGCTGPARELSVTQFQHRKMSDIKLAVVNTHFITHAYNDPPYNPGCQQLWNTAWSKLKDHVASLHDRGYDVVVTADFNRHSDMPTMHADARLMLHDGPDYIYAVPSKGRKITDSSTGIIDTSNLTHESEHKDKWIHLTFADQ
jgi:hypothetical protein